MKRQLILSQSGFTLFELMIVIAIFSAFVVVTGSFDWRPQTDIEKADRMQVVLSSTLRSEIQNVSIGKMPKRDGKTATLTTLTIGTGGVITSYSGTTGEIWSGSFLYPFFDGDAKYILNRVTWTWSTSTGGYVGTGQVLIRTSGISFSWTNISDANQGYNILEIQAKYNQAYRTVSLDRRTGKITESKR